MKISGIYKIINKTNGHYYVGSSTNIESRWKDHKKKLNCNCHHNDYLSKAWHKYGKEAFEFLIIESNISNDQLSFVEQKYLDKALTEREKCYNLSFDAECPIRMLDDYSKKKLSDSNSGEKNGFYGKKHSQETINTITQKNRKWSTEWWEKIGKCDPMWSKRTITGKLKEELKSYYLTYGYISLMKRGKELGYGGKLMGRFVKEIRKELGIPKGKLIIPTNSNRRFLCKQT